MNCREFVEFLWRYTSDELSPEERVIFADHLSRCRHCVKYLQSYKKRFGSEKPPSPHLRERFPTEVPEDLIKAILASRSKAT